MKDKILQTLLRKPKITINDLAEAVGINPISVRHHLTNLQMEGLIAAEEERHGVGRPRLVYSLTEDGMERFPTKYLRLTTRLLAQMKESMPGPLVTELFNQVAEDLASEYSSQIQGLSMEERLEFVKELLAQEGF
ncbi:MAG: winged helix-turn-helix transcriptional regulator, partial [Anaerolineales bacterium]